MIETRPCSAPQVGLSSLHTDVVPYSVSMSWSVTLFKKACHVPGCSECRATTGLLKTILSVSTGILCKQSFLVRKYLLKIHLCILVEDHSKILVLCLVLHFCRILPAVKISLKTGELVYVFIVRICIFFYRK